MSANPHARPSPAPQSGTAAGSAREAEAAWIARAQAGDRDAFERLAVRSMPALMGTALRLLRDRFAAEEAVADALYRGWRRIESFRGEAGFSTWLHRIVCRVAADRFRRTARDRRLHAALCDRSARDAAPRLEPLDTLAHEETGRRLRAAVERLPDRQRLVLVLHVWEGLSLRETAEALELRYATAKSNLCHARKSLRALMAEENR